MVFKYTSTILENSDIVQLLMTPAIIKRKTCSKLQTLLYLFSLLVIARACTSS